MPLHLDKIQVTLTARGSKEIISTSSACRSPALVVQERFENTTETGLVPLGGGAVSLLLYIQLEHPFETYVGEVCRSQVCSAEWSELLAVSVGGAERTGDARWGEALGFILGFCLLYGPISWAGLPVPSPSPSLVIIILVELGAPEGILHCLLRNPSHHCYIFGLTASQISSQQS